MANNKPADIACSAITIDEASIAIAWQAICAEISIAAIMHELISRVLWLLAAVFLKGSLQPSRFDSTKPRIADKQIRLDILYDIA